MLEQSLFNFLETIAPGKSHAVKLPEKPRYPALVYVPVSENRKNKIDGSGVLNIEARIQVDAWARTFAEAKNLANVLRNVLDGFAGDFQGTEVGLIRMVAGRDNFDYDAKLYRVTTDLIIYY